MTMSSSVPTGLRDRVLAASRSARDGGRSVPAAPTITATEAFARAADAFAGLLSALSVEQWHTRVLRELDVQGLVGHLMGVERDVQRALVGDEDVADSDHVVSTQDLADAQIGRDPAETRAQWRQAADHTLELVRADGRDPGSLLSMHGMRLSLDALLVVRAFELWTHENDIRSAVAMPASVPDASTLTLMTELAVRLLPHAVSRTEAVSAPLELHLVLTGNGGGTWDLPLGEREAATEPTDLMIVVDAVDFCRLVANRVDPQSLDLHVDGDGADRVLAAAASLALD
jgi:uncharacterized protein (TIGR03083 family)